MLPQLKRTKKKYKRDFPQFATISNKREIFKFPWPPHPTGIP
jgi:hypothetical protein